MISILIIEDDFLWQVKLENMLRAQKNCEVIGIANTIKEGIRLMETLEPDIVISDLYFGDENILDTQINEIPTIYISNSEFQENYLNTQRNPLSLYLVKPFHSFSLISSINLLIKNVKPKISPFVIIRNTNNTFVKLKFSNITHIVGEGNYCVFYSDLGKKFAKKISLKKLHRELLDDNFIQINRNIIINKSFVDNINFNQNTVSVFGVFHNVGRIYRNALTSFLDYNEVY